MKVKIAVRMTLLDFNKAKGQDMVTVEPGVYEMEEIDNPKGGDRPWLVLKGRTVGATRGAIIIPKKAWIVSE